MLSLYKLVLMDKTKHIVNFDFLLESTESDLPLIETMIRIFHQTYPDYVLQMNDLVQDKNWEELSRIAHKAKATTSAFGMSESSDFLSLIEHSAKKQPENVHFKEIIDKFEYQCKIASNELNEFITKYPNHD